ncbi:MAG: hypothetical protein JWR90_1810 [Marmoricola sp.]|jgi:hypothetical protein|nr:hypothetical protein [Marmoricola sp.]
MSNEYPPPTPEQDPAGQSNQPPPPPPSEPQWNPQSAGPPPSGSGGEPGYGQPGYGQPGYGQPPGYPPPPPGAPGGYGAYGVPQKTSPLAIVSLVLGIVGICCGQLFVLSIGAIVTGSIGRNQIKQSNGQLKGGGMALAGLILGVVGIVVGIGYWILIATGAINGEFNFSTS